MQTITSTEELRTTVKNWKRDGLRVGFVPTMGYLHEGHLSLMKQAKKAGDKVICSIFVNPTQFNDKKDFEAYPIDLKRDAALLESVGVDLLFAPNVSEIYGTPGTAQSWVTVEELSKPWEGAHRPGHFRGVTTVVSILFNLVSPDFAVFGEKDFQQLRLIEQMVTDLKFDVEIIRGALIREPDGLAMSSRNVRLSPEARTAALAISRGLFRARAKFQSGERSRQALVDTVRSELSDSELVKIEYIDLAAEDTLEVSDQLSRPARLLVAAFVGGVRLIDNVAIGD